MDIWKFVRAVVLRLLMLGCIVAVLGMAFCLSSLVAMIISNLLAFDFWPLAIMGMAFLGLVLLAPLLAFLEEGGWLNWWL